MSDAPPSRGDHPFARGYVAWILRHGKAIWLLALLLAVPATFRTASLYIHLRSEIEELLPRRSPSVGALEELRTRMPGLQHLAVVIDTGTPQNLHQGEAFLDDLAAKIRAYPPELAHEVRTGNKAERKFLQDHAPLYVDTSDLLAIKNRIEARRDFEVSRETGASLDDNGPAPPLDFSDLEAKYKAKLGEGASTRFPDGRFSNAEKHLTLLLIDLGEYSTGGGHGSELLKRLKADIAALGGTDHYAPGMRLGLTGEVVVNAEETSALVSDLSIASVLCILAVGLVLLFYYRWWKSIPILVAPLLMATVYAFGAASLPPLHITELNSNTAFLGSILVGNGINFGIILLARYVEERRRGFSTEEALATSVWGARTGTLSAALAAGASYAALIVTQFRGFRQFGFLGGIGMLFSWAVAFLLMPPLIAWLDPSDATRPEPRTAKAAGWLGEFVRNHSVAVVMAGALITTIAATAAPKFSLSQIELDLSKLRRADTWKNGDGYWARQQNDLLGEYLTPTVMLTDSRDQAETVAKAVRAAATEPPLRQSVSLVRTADDILPPEQETKIRLANQIREDMTPKMRALLSPERKKDIDELLGAPELHPITAADLPQILSTAVRERDSSYGKTVLVYPAVNEAMWEARPLIAFVAELRELAKVTDVGGGKAARVAGALPVSADVLESVLKDGPTTTIAAFAGVVIVVLILFRGHKTTLYVLGSLVLGVFWLFAATTMLNVKVNFANFIAFPITFGIGVDYSVNLVTRYIQDGEGDPADAVRSVGGAVALCSMTTIIGYSTLLLAENRALFLFGLVAVMGEICCLATALLILPAVLELLHKRRQRSLALAS
jgi:predicted RND superfamily exporter protein